MTDYDTVSFENDARKKLNYILNDTDENIIYHSCVGNNSGSDLDYHAFSIIKENKYKETELNLLICKILFSGFTRMLPGLPVISLTFIFTRGDSVLKMVMNQKMKVMNDQTDPIRCKTYEVDNNEKCYIVFS
jgi:hypothetical protein